MSTLSKPSCEDDDDSASTTLNLMASLGKYWPIKRWRKRRPISWINRRVRGTFQINAPGDCVEELRNEWKDSDSTSTSLTRKLASCSPRTAGTAPPPKIRSESRTGDELYNIPEAANNTVDLSALSQGTTLLDYANTGESQSRSGTGGVEKDDSFEETKPLCSLDATNKAQQSSLATGTQQAIHNQPTYFDAMKSWSQLMAPMALSGSLTFEGELLQITKDIRHAMPNTGDFLQMTQEILASIKENNSSEIADGSLSDHPTSSPLSEGSDIGERSVDEGTILPSSPSLPQSPARTHTSRLAETLHATTASKEELENGAIGLSTVTPTSQVLSHPSLRLKRTHPGETMFQQVHGYDQICEEFEYGQTTDVLLNELKWGLKVNPEEIEFTTHECEAFDPLDPGAVPEVVHISVEWAYALEILTQLSTRIRRFSEGTRDCIKEVHAENCLLKRRVCEMETAVEDQSSEVAELRRKVKMPETSLTMVLNSGMHNVTSTRMADHSLNRVSKAMHQSLMHNTPSKSSRQTVQTPYYRRARQPLEEVSSPAQLSSLQRPICSARKENQRCNTSVYEDTNTNENLEDELMAVRDFQEIVRGPKPAPLKVWRPVDSAYQGTMWTVDEYDERPAASSGAVLDPAEEAAFDNDSEIC